MGRRETIWPLRACSRATVGRVSVVPRIFDNIGEHLSDSLVKTLEKSIRLDTSVGYFNLRGWRQLADSVDGMPAPDDGERVRLLIGMTDRPDVEFREMMRVGGYRDMDTKQAARLRTKVVQHLRDQLTYGVPTTSDEKALRHLKRQLVDGAVQVKLYLKHRLHAKLYLCHRDDHDNPMTGYLGSSNLTFAGLAHQGELNVDVLDHDATKKLDRWFNDRWEDPFSVDITQDLIEVLDQSWATDRLLAPYDVYLKMAYHLSREAREGLLEYGLPETMAQQLLEYQAAAVRVAARILDRRGGVMIGDVVGLGKTIVATAIARLLQEEMGTETLIICPKNLTEMWQGYVDEYRLHAKVVSLSMTTKDLPNLRRYTIVIVDESHNLRNPKRKDYAEIRDYIERNDSKVILLTATPYNKRYADVASQLGLFVRGDANLGIQPDRAIQKEGEIDFLRRCDGNPQTLNAFAKSDEPEDWRRLMSLYLVRRTRNFIKDNYAEADGDRFYLTFGDGSRFYFPERIPKKIVHHVEADDPAAKMVSDATLDAIGGLRLPRYALSEYLLGRAKPTPTENEILDDLSLAGGNLIGVTKSMLYKRLSSSAAAFLISLRRHLLRNWVYLNAIHDGGSLPIGHVDDTLWDDDEELEQDHLDGDEFLDFDQDPEEWSDIAQRAYGVLVRKGSKSIRWIRSELFSDGLAEDLEEDIATIQSLLEEFGTWRQEEDTKLDALENLLSSDHPDEKVLVFTEYKDTAEYVAASLERRGIAAIAGVSGSTDDPTMAARRFSPKSNEEIGGLPSRSNELRVLIATDVLSEGQNLQDAHIVANYDLPWAIIKIIQRAGRIDRVGQRSPEVLVYSFVPDDNVENVINLRSRIAQRLEENAAVFGSDEAFFGGDDEQQFIKGLYDENSRLEDIDEEGEEVDWASMAYEIWRQATENDDELGQRIAGMPDVVYATRPAHQGEAEGVIVYTQTDLGYDGLAFTGIDGASELLSPYEALRRAECEPGTKAEPPLPNHHELVAQAVTGPLQSPIAHLEGAVTGVRKRTWERMANYKEKYAGTLFDNERLDRALDELYRRPLRDTATQTLAKALRERTPEEIADLIIALHQERRLCVDDVDIEDDELHIVCSLGVKA